MRSAVIGAGATGLAAARDLARAGAEVVVLEASDRVGGLAAGFRPDGWEWSLEQYYHHWFESDSEILDLARELGVADRVVFRRPTTTVYDDGAFHAFDSPATMLRFLARRCGLLAAIRFGAVGLSLKLRNRWEPLEAVTADAWMRRACGDAVHEAVWRPLLVSKFGEANLDVVNMAWLWARIKARTPRLGTFVGGFQAFLETLASDFERRGGTLRVGAPVTSVRRADGGLVVETAAGREVFDAVLATTSPAVLARLAPDLPPEAVHDLRGLQSMGAVVLVVALDRPLTRHYWHSLRKDAGFPFLALVEHTNFVEPARYGGNHLLYCGDYVADDSDLLRVPEDEVKARWLPALARFNAAYDPSWIRGTWLFRTPYAQPVPGLFHSRRLPPVHTAVQGLFHASMTHVHPWDRGTNHAVGLGRRVARLMLDQRSATP